MQEEINLHVGVLVVKINNFNFDTKVSENKTGKISNEMTINYGIPEVPNYPIKEGMMLISATTQVKYYQSNFISSAEVTGVFEVPENYGNAIQNDDDSNIELVQELTSKLFPILTAKFRSYTGLFSNEVNSFSIVPELNTDVSELERKD